MLAYFILPLNYYCIDEAVRIYKRVEKGNERVAEVKANGGDAHFISVNVLEEAQLVSAKNEIFNKNKFSFKN